MLAVATCGYLLFHGLPLSSASGKKMPKTIVEEEPSEEEKVSQEIQKRLSEGNNHQAVYKLWQRIKSLDMPSCSFPLFGVVESMEKLGKSTEAILGEFRSALECNESLFTSDTTQALL